jgi:hypothetical protein
MDIVRHGLSALLGRGFLGGVCFFAVAAQLMAEPALFLPSYFYPGAQWNRVIASSAAVRMAIINPASGAGKAVNVDYRRTVQSARASGVSVLGYVATAYAGRDAQAVLDEVARYVAWYGVDGIFLDEVASEVSQVGYYAHLREVIRQEHQRIIVLNPGTHPDEAFMAVADFVVTFEGNFDRYRALRPPEWVQRYAPQRFIHIVYDVSQVSRMRRVLSWAKAYGADLVYATNDLGPNPYDALPIYWTSLVNALVPARN